MMMLRRVLFLVLVAWAAGPLRIASSQRAVSEEGWRRDIRTLRRLVATEHLNAFHSISRERFEASFDDLEKQVGTLAAPAVLVGLMKGMARLRDVHSCVVVQGWELPRLPISFARYGHEVRVLMAGAGHEDLLGARFEGLGGRDAETVLALLSELIPEEVAGSARQRAHKLLAIPYLLAGLGLSPREDACDFTFSKDGGRPIRRRLKARGMKGGRHVFDTLPAVGRLACLRGGGRWNWFERLEDSGTLYAHYGRVADQPGRETVAAFAARLLAAAKDDIERLVIDVRDNPGGGSHLSRPLIEGIQGHPRIDRIGRLFVITGPRTASAAVQFVFALEKRTRAIFVGAPPMQGPAFYSDPRTYTLPASGLSLRLSRTHWVMSHPGDTRETLVPDLPAPFTWADLVAGRDPALEAIIGFDADRVPALGERVRRRRTPDQAVQYVGSPTVPPR